MMPSDPIAPIWLVLPLALIALVVQAGYLIALKELPKGMMPASRKRIRTASSWMSMFVIPLSAYGFGIATMDDPGLFTIVWMMVIGLIAGILMLAGLDAVNTLRLHRRAKQGLKAEYRQSLRLTKPVFEDEDE
ncbi:hypothetical protein COB72_04890 [bacterium]|nr:MAG: hypothetical protein COB72_04890 [bacterium]